MFKNIDYHFGEADLATLFYKLLGNNYRYSSEKLYCFNGVFWEYNPTKILLKKHFDNATKLGMRIVNMTE